MTQVKFPPDSTITYIQVPTHRETDALRPQPMLAFSRSATPHRPRVVITGISALAPNGNTAEEFWANCLAGQSGIGPVTVLDATPFITHFAGEVKNFDPRNFMEAKEARRISRCSQYALACAQMASDNARLKLPVENPERVGVLMGTAVGGYDMTESGMQTLIKKGWHRVSPFTIGGAMPNAPAFHIGMRVGSQGYLSTITTACASGTQAIGEASEIIRRGWADVMFAGGAECGVLELAFAGFQQMRAISTYNENPQKASRPFDKNRDGFVLADGAAVMVLESLEHAIARNAPIYAEVLGSSAVSDAYDISAPDPTGAGEVRVMRLAMTDAGVAADEIDYINAHATSTIVGDVAETVAIKKLFGERAAHIPISATKSMIGHSLGAAGALEAVASTMTLRDQKIHPTINYETPDPECDLDYVPNQARAARVVTILSNSFGLGGQNACLILRRFDK